MSPRCASAWSHTQSWGCIWKWDNVIIHLLHQDNILPVDEQTVEQLGAVDGANHKQLRLCEGASDYLIPEGSTWCCSHRPHHTYGPFCTWYSSQVSQAGWGGDAFKAVADWQAQSCDDRAEGPVGWSCYWSELPDSPGQCQDELVGGGAGQAGGPAVSCQGSSPPSLSLYSWPTPW